MSKLRQRVTSGEGIARLDDATATLRERDQALRQVMAMDGTLHEIAAAWTTHVMPKAVDARNAMDGFIGYKQTLHDEKRASVSRVQQRAAWAIGNTALAACWSRCWAGAACSVRPNEPTLRRSRGGPPPSRSAASSMPCWTSRSESSRPIRLAGSCTSAASPAECWSRTTSPGEPRSPPKATTQVARVPRGWVSLSGRRAAARARVARGRGGARGDPVGHGARLFGDGRTDPRRERGNNRGRRRAGPLSTSATTAAIASRLSSRMPVPGRHRIDTLRGRPDLLFRGPAQTPREPGTRQRIGTSRGDAATVVAFGRECGFPRGGGPARAFAGRSC